MNKENKKSKIRIKKGDTVKITKGKDRGKEGKVLYVNPMLRKVTVEGLNLFKKHVRPRRQGEKGETVQIARPISVANIIMICPSCKQSTRVGFMFSEKTKHRMCKKCKNFI